MKPLYLLRGLPGSGKSTLADELCGDSGTSMEADSYFMVSKYHNGKIINRHQYNGVYEFDATKLKEAHSDCQNRADDAMSWGISPVVVSNTFTQKWEMDAYYDMAKQHGYTVFSLIVENRHGGKNIHGVPDSALNRMEDRFEVKLR
jgi:predicted kinase